MPYEIYAAYQQAEAAFRALYFGRPLDTETLLNRPSTKIVQRHWTTMEHLAETLLLERSLTPEQALKLLLRASLDATADAAGATKGDARRDAGPSPPQWPSPAATVNTGHA